MRVGKIDDVEKLLKATFIHESDENYPKDALHMYAENEPATKRNESVLNNLFSELDCGMIMRINKSKKSRNYGNCGNWVVLRRIF